MATGVKLVRSVSDVDDSMISPFVPWTTNPYAGPVKIIYEVGGSYEAVGISGVMGYSYGSGIYYTVVPAPVIDIRDPINAYRGILVFASLDDWFVKTTIPGALPNWNRPAIPGNPLGDPPTDPVPFRYLSVTYDDADVLGVGSASGGRSLSPGALSVAAITVVEEVTP